MHSFNNDCVFLLVQGQLHAENRQRAVKVFITDHKNMNCVITFISIQSEMNFKTTLQLRSPQQNRRASGQRGLEPGLE